MQITPNFKLAYRHQGAFPRYPPAHVYLAPCPHMMYQHVYIPRCASTLKKQLKLSPKHIVFAGIFALTFIGITILLFSYKRDEKRFSHITSQLFVDEMCASTLNMHYTIAYPEQMGLKDLTTNLIPFTRLWDLALYFLRV